MITVKDTAGCEWRFAITWGLAERWKDNGICDLFDKPAEFQPSVLEVLQLFYDESTTKGDKPTDVEFKDAIDESVLNAITSAWRSELENFIRAHNPLMGAGIQEINRTIDAKTQEGEAAARRLVQESGIAESLTRQLNETEQKAASEIKAAITNGPSESQAKSE